MTGRYMREVSELVSGLGARMGQVLLSLPVQEQAALQEVSRSQAEKQTEEDVSSCNRQ